MPQALIWALVGVVAALFVDRTGHAVEDVGQGVDAAGSGALKLAAAVGVGYWLSKQK